MSPKELRDLADLIERGRARATARVEVNHGHEDFLGYTSVAGEQRPVRQVQESRILVEVTLLGPSEVFIRDCFNPQGRWHEYEEDE